MRRAAAVVVAVLMVASPARAGTDALPAAVLDASVDLVHRRVDVPGTARKVGEVRLVERGGAIVVQTLLATRVIDRVVAEIRKKEDSNWPVDAPGHEDMLEYVGALVAVAGDLERARDAGAGDRRIRLAIEFVAKDEAVGVAFLTFEGDETDGALVPHTRHVLESRRLRRTYVYRNMRLILADAYDMKEADVGHLGPLGPATPEPPPRP